MTKELEDRVRRALRKMADDVPSRPMTSNLARKGRRLAILRFGGGGLLVVVLIVWLLSFVPGGGGASSTDVAGEPQEGESSEGTAGGPLRTTGEVAFVDHRGQPSVLLESLDGSNQSEILRADNITGIDWSPDGRLLVAGLGLGEGSSSIVTMDLRDGSRETIVGPNKGVANPQDPNWSADGKQIAFSNATGDIYVVSRTGHNLRQVTHSGDTCSDLFPSWSPDGSELAFTRDCGNARIFKISLAQDDLETLTMGPADYHPAWSPDGTQIAFTRDLDNIFLVDPTGAGEIQITEVPENYEPEWSADGNVIVFSSNRDGNQELYAINADGTGEERLTNSAGDQTMPAWRPRN